MLQAVQRAVEPSVVCRLYAGSARLHKILRIKVRAIRIGRSRRVHDRQVTLLPQGLKGGKRRMQAKESIKIKHVSTRNADAGPHGVILRLGMRHHNIQAVSRAPLENHDQPLVARGSLRRAPCSPSEKAWHRRGADHGERAVAKKNSTSNGHKVVVEK